MMCLSVLSDKCDGVEPLMSKSLPANGGFADGRWQACSHTAFYNPSWRAGMGLGGAEVNFSDLDVICQEWLGV